MSDATNKSIEMNINNKDFLKVEAPIKKEFILDKQVEFVKEISLNDVLEVLVPKEELVAINVKNINDIRSNEDIFFDIDLLLHTLRARLIKSH